MQIHVLCFLCTHAHGQITLKIGHSMHLAQPGCNLNKTMLLNTTTVPTLFSPFVVKTVSSSIVCAEIITVQTVDHERCIRKSVAFHSAEMWARVICLNRFKSVALWKQWVTQKGHLGLPRFHSSQCAIWQKPCHVNAMTNYNIWMCLEQSRIYCMSGKYIFISQ